MSLLEWIRRTTPGSERIVGDELQIRHKDGSVSSLWRRDRGCSIPDEWRPLVAFYEELDGADLFSSAFKIASIRESRWSGGVKLVPNRTEMADDAAAASCSSPGAAVFMSQAGIGYYSVDPGGLVIECDESTGETRHFSDPLAVFEDWLSALRPDGP